MVWRISAGLGPAEPRAPVDPAGPPVNPPLATVVRRAGGASRSWGARLACLTRRGRPSMSALPPGPAVPGPAEPASDPPGAEGSGPVWRDSSQGGPAACPGRGEAIGVIAVAGPVAAPGPPAARPPPAPGRLCSVQPGNGAGWSGYGAGPVPGNGAAGAEGGGGAEPVPENGEPARPGPG